MTARNGIDLGASNAHLTELAHNRAWQNMGNDPRITPLEPGTQVDAEVNDRVAGVTINPSEPMTHATEPGGYDVLAHISAADTPAGERPEAIVFSGSDGKKSLMDRNWNVESLDRLHAGTKIGAATALRGAGVSVQQGSRPGFTVARTPHHPVTRQPYENGNIVVTYKV